MYGCVSGSRSVLFSRSFLQLSFVRPLSVPQADASWAKRLLEWVVSKTGNEFLYPGGVGQVCSTGYSPAGPNPSSMKYLLLFVLLLLTLSSAGLGEEVWVRNKPFEGATEGSGTSLKLELPALLEALSLKVKRDYEFLQI